MKVPAIFSLLLVLGEAFASSAVDSNKPKVNLAKELQAEGFTIIPASFTGPYSPNNETITLHGTIQEVLAQIRAANPSHHALLASGANMPNSNYWNGPIPDVHPRGLDCSHGYFAKQFDIFFGISYLHDSVKDSARMEVPVCTRVSCSYDSAIYLCWEPHEGGPRKKEVSWDYVADFAWSISKVWCPTIVLPDTKIGVRGKAWDNDGMAVIVGADDC
ncbi:hypothetical protein jhhlp_006561 [Lomentospora prolificans]|uniref:Uncharacterized protein n=1 Tax=Lomentospora prolificans TaxID=41688 RepID=A0A2N3N682_9PEZI|nr:hypothetical protein jhhlp_006561 [Lomentospora prolificans]